MLTRQIKERIIEHHLKSVNAYRSIVKKHRIELDHLFPSLVDYGHEYRSIDYISNRTDAAAILRIEMAEKIQREIKKYEIIIKGIENSYSILSENERLFCELRYEQGLTMDSIKDVIGYSETRSIYRIKEKAFDKLLIALNFLTMAD
jgi:DNA-directed RNA polymerase specialized sigma subunit